MPENEIAGTNWSTTELDLIVSDYFNMLADELAGREYNKAAHRRNLMEHVHRSGPSIEFKHRNISAVLEKLGLPRINGYVPAWNFQGAIVEAVDRFLGWNPNPVPFAPVKPIGFGERPTLFVGPPPVVPKMSKEPQAALNRLTRKFDPALKDQLNRQLGLAGEEHIFEYEQKKLFDGGRKDLSTKVTWVSQVEGDGAGYDIRSYKIDGSELWLEVKTTRGGGMTPFYLTRNEWNVATEHPDSFRLYRLYEFSKEPKLFTLAPPLEDHLQLEPITYRASLAPQSLT